MSSSQHLSSQSQTEGIRNQKLLQCRVCKSTNFDEDDETGFMICNDCGAQALEYTQESFALEDGNAATKVYGRLNFKRLTSKQRQRVKSENILKNSFDIDLTEFLSAYQYSLKFLAEHLAVVADLSNTHELLGELKSLWLAYLNAFRKNNVNMTSLLLHTNSNHDVIFKFLPPSGTLLLGFLYFACRLLRLWVTPADLVKWCTQGDLPYYRLFTMLPPDKKRMLANNSKFMFQLEVMSPTLIFYHTVKISEMIGKTIPQLNTPLIAKTFILGLGLPSEVWDVYVKISCLFTAGDPFHGLESWNEHYSENIMASIIIACKFCRWTEWSITTVEEALKTNYSNPNFLSIRSRRKNVSKSISIDTITESVVPLQIPLSMSELDYVSRMRLPELLGKMKKVLLVNTEHVAGIVDNLDNNNKKKRIDQNRLQTFRGTKFHGKEIFNDAMKSVLLSAYRNGNKNEIAFCKIFETDYDRITCNSNWQQQAVYSSDSHTCAVVVNGNQIPNSQLIPHQQSVLSEIKKGSIKRVKKLNNGDFIHKRRVPYILYVNDNAIPGTINDRAINANQTHSSSTEGNFHVQYLILLERFARYLRTSPNLLHKLVDQNETHFYGLISPSDIHKSKVTSLGKSNKAHNEIYEFSTFFPDMKQNSLDPTNAKTYDDLDGFNFDNNISTMPLLRQLGLSILYNEDNQKQNKKNDNDDDNNSSDSSDSNTCL